MYGVSKELNLSAFIGAEVTQVCFGVADVQINFIVPGGDQPNISIAGGFKIQDYLGTGEKRLPGDSVLLNLLGKTVKSATPLPPDKIRFEFSGGTTLSLIDSSSEYESFTLQPGNIVV